MSTDQHTAQTAGLEWFKSSYSGTSGGDCVEVAADLDVVYVRDSKAPGGRPVLRIARAEWAAFVTLAVK
ncbi:DUF397 domain-containing protein [Streptomyces sp. H51]|uniref:DUF397 domain-containing protein n=1 Tax=Streptomyces sp. H51 TaxID=3111770 RepID=UPI002D765D8F|nr:DUF397 domain-containing protein [Streptomyces sp. H51]